MSTLITGDYNVGDVISLLWFKRQLPKYATRFIELVVMLCADHGPCVSGIASRLDWVTHLLSTCICLLSSFAVLPQVLFRACAHQQNSYAASGLLTDRKQPQNQNALVHAHRKQHGTAQHGTAWHSTAQHSTAQHSTAQHSTADQTQFGIAQHDLALHSIAQHGMTVRSMAQHSLADLFGLLLRLSENL